MIDELSEKCPNCGAPLSGANRTSSEQPKTIEELKAWYDAHHLPPEEITRFFIGKNITEPKAFGIYKDGNGDFVVYKNKASGERAIRYQGSDEQYAVNELYQRLKAEIADQKGSSQPKATQQPMADKKKSRKKGCLIAIIIVVAMCIIGAILDDTAPNGYYHYQGQEYYHQGTRWYYYDANTNDWYESDNEEWLDERITDKNADEYRFEDHNGKSFENSQWYDSGQHHDDSDWDSDSNWDSGSDSWDSGGTDWDSDW